MIFYKLKTLKKNIKNFLTKISLLLILLIFPNLILIYIKYPIYDGLRLFLWFTPYLVIIPAIVFSYLINDNNFLFKSIKIIFLFLFVLHLINFIKITPYHYTFLNYFSGNIEERYKQFENDYWSVSLKELILSSNLPEKKINYITCGTSLGIVKTYMKEKYGNAEYTNLNSANYIIMTNRTLYSKKSKSISNCFDEYDFENVAEVKRNGLILSAIKKLNNFYENVKNKNPDLLIVGAGPVGCVIAERAAKIKKWTSLIVEKRNHIAGNCYDEINNRIKDT